MKLSATTALAASWPGLPAGFSPLQAKTVAAAGEAEILTVSDGHLTLPLSFAYPDVAKGELEALLADQINAEGAIEPPLNLTILKQGERRVLFDVGSGSNFMPTAGRLAEGLDAAGITPEDITDVIFTHGHPDHLWGLLDDFDEVAFPNAQLHAPRAEFDFWMDEDTVNLMPEARQSFAVGARNRFEAVKDDIALFEPGGELLPGIETVATHGHTPGHTSYVIHATGAPVMVIGDALTHPVISFQRPQWPSGSDQDTDKGMATRLALLDRLAADDATIIGYHLPGDGAGRVERAGDAYRFIPT